jgi:hypothetical protein
MQDLGAEAGPSTRCGVSLIARLARVQLVRPVGEDFSDRAWVPENGPGTIQDPHREDVAVARR